jgi:hypothetical protein
MWTDGWTDKRTDMTKLIVAVRNFANAPKTEEYEEAFVPFCNFDWFLPNSKLQQGALDSIVTIDNLISLIINTISVISLLILYSVVRASRCNSS